MTLVYRTRHTVGHLACYFDGLQLIAQLYAVRENTNDTLRDDLTRAHGARLRCCSGALLHHNLVSIAYAVSGMRRSAGHPRDRSNSEET